MSPYTFFSLTCEIGFIDRMYCLSVVGCCWFYLTKTEIFCIMNSSSGRCLIVIYELKTPRFSPAMISKWMRTGLGSSKMHGLALRCQRPQHPLWIHPRELLKSSDVTGRAPWRIHRDQTQSFALLEQGETFVLYNPFFLSSCFSEFCTKMEKGSGEDEFMELLCKGQSGADHLKYFK